MLRNILIAFLCLMSVAQAQTSISVPEGYVLQDLQPTAGQIARPADWQYRHVPSSNGWTWIIAATDPSKWYDTGWRTQVLLGVEAGTKRPRRDFVQNFLQQKRNSSRVLRDCPETDQGEFRLACLEVVETLKAPHGAKNYRILYSVFWGKQMDMVYVTTSGAPEEEWESVRPIFEVMRSFIVVGADFIDRAKKSQP